ncbi:MAG: nitroreductase family protein [Aquificaceae bacterium]|nr:nitroreductase family protein [Aquificaceae bacterium]MDW8066746.1 nitroreductase family protein [Aquificaceae bacterium]MDW8423507.1 nitroreductase family protein [Aquificaceae bacterium]
MEFFEVLKKRRSVRSYHNRPVEREKLIKIMEAVRSAPSAGNLQAYEVVLVLDEVKRTEVARWALNQWFIAEAPAVFVFFANPQRSASKYGKRGAELYCLQDATIACAYAQLSAVALGLGTCWVGAFEEAGLKACLSVPASWKPVSILTVGYPAEEPFPTPRRELEDIFTVI